MMQYLNNLENDEQPVLYFLGEKDRLKSNSQQEELELLHEKDKNNFRNMLTGYVGQNFQFVEYLPLQVIYNESQQSGHKPNLSVDQSEQKQSYSGARSSSIIFKRRSQLLRREKNSNAIKKIGRIILDNIKWYQYNKKSNNSVACMLKMLSRDSKIGRTEINKRDKFNTYHLRLLLNGQEGQRKNNLLTTRQILCSKLRKEVLESRQITDKNKILYMNTMKCSALRCINKDLAVRLQMAL